MCFQRPRYRSKMRRPMPTWLRPLYLGLLWYKLSQWLWKRSGRLSLWLVNRFFDIRSHNNNKYLTMNNLFFQIVHVIPTALMVVTVVQTQFVLVVKIRRPRMKKIWNNARQIKALISASASLIATTIDLAKTHVSICSKTNMNSVRVR